MRTIVKYIFRQCPTQLLRPAVHFTRTLEPATRSRKFSSTRIPLYANQSVPRRTFCEAHDFVCWNCNKTTGRTDQLFCKDCGSLRDADENFDYFKLLTLSNSFDINPTELTTKFRTLQNAVHPDKFSNSSEREQSNSMAWSSLINKACKTLSEPIDRGEYLLLREGMTLPKDNSVLNMEFLLEMMEKNEEVEDATSDNILELLKNVRSDLEDSAAELQDVFDEGNFERAKSVLVKMKYFKSLEKSIKEKAIQLGVVK